MLTISLLGFIGFDKALHHKVTVIAIEALKCTVFDNEISMHHMKEKMQWNVYVYPSFHCCNLYWFRVCLEFHNLRIWDPDISTM